MRNYQWSKQTIRRGWLTIAEVAARLHVSTWTARRWLVRSGFPAQLYVRYWRGSNGRVYRRQAWGCPPETVEGLRLMRFRANIAFGLRSLARMEAEWERRRARRSSTL